MTEPGVSVMEISLHGFTPRYDVATFCVELEPEPDPEPESEGEPPSNTIFQVASGIPDVLLVLEYACTTRDPYNTPSPGPITTVE